MATYINYGEQGDAIVQAAEWLRVIIRNQKSASDESAFFTKFQGLYADNESPKFNVGPVLDLFVERTEQIFSVIPEVRNEDKIKEVESYFAVVLSMFSRLQDESDLEKSTNSLGKVLSDKPEQHPELRLRLLMMLYNSFPPLFPMRYRIFKHAIDFAAKSSLFDLVVPYLEYLDDWMVDWAPNMKEEDKQALFLDISTYMRQLGKRQEAFAYLRRYMGLFQGKDAACKQAQEAAVQIIKDAVELPSVLQFDDILGLDAVKALGKSKQSGDLVELCNVFLTGGVADLTKFNEKSKKTFKDNGLSYEDARSKIKLLAIASLCLGKSEIHLSEVAKVIEEKEDNVEPWVVRALSDGVIDGRIDQLNQKVMIKSAFQRKFGKEEWEFLDNKLQSWVDNLESVIKFIGEQKKAGNLVA